MKYGKEYLGYDFIEDNKCVISEYKPKYYA
jgi:hypothetical protein